MAISPPTRCAPDDPHLSYLGHWDVNAAAATTVNSGSRLTFGFTGRSLVAQFATAAITNPPQIYVSVDAGAPVVYAIGSDQVDLTPTALADGTHTVEIAVKDVDERANRWVPPLASALVISGFVLDPDAGLVTSVPEYARKMAFYGDSITQGVNAVSATPGPDGADGTKGYAFLTAQAFRAANAQVGFGAQGILNPGNGNVPPAPQTWGYNFLGSPADPAFVPDAVVVNQGTNDHGSDSAQFQSAYQSYLGRIRASCPDSWIFAMRPFGGNHQDDIGAAVAAAQDPKIVYVDTTGWLQQPQDFADGLHPTAAGHARAAARLVEVISGKTGWS